MGKEIAYCFKCQRRILGHEYEKGLAYAVENHVCCSTCAVDVLETLPPKAKEQLLAKMFKATEERKQSNAALPTPSATATRRIPVAPPRALPAVAASGGASAMVVTGILAAVVGLVLIIVLVSGNSSAPVSTPAAPALAAGRPVVPKPPPVEDRATTVAREAVRKAREYAQANPSDADGQYRQWQAVLLDAQNSGFEPEVKRELAKAELRMKEATQKELLDFEKKVVELSGRREISAGLDLVARERTRHSSPEWGAVLDRLDRDLRELAGRLFGELKQKVVAARARGSRAEGEAAKAEVAKWGLPQYVQELDALVQGEWRPIFDGRTTECLSNGSLPFWRVVDGALTPIPSAQKQAAQSRADYADGEIRFRFTQKNCSLVTFAVRQWSNSCRLALDRNDLGKTGEGEHEVLFTCRGDQVTATIDGRPAHLDNPPKPLPKGRLQFGASEGEFRVLSVEHRELP